jgi:hypothetical protein
MVGVLSYASAENREPRITRELHGIPLGPVSVPIRPSQRSGTRWWWDRAGNVWGASGPDSWDGVGMDVGTTAGISLLLASDTFVYRRAGAVKVGQRPPEEFSLDARRGHKGDVAPSVRSTWMPSGCGRATSSLQLRFTSERRSPHPCDPKFGEPRNTARAISSRASKSRVAPSNRTCPFSRKTDLSQISAAIFKLCSTTISVIPAS